MAIKSKAKTDLLRKLHSLAKEKLEIEDVHPLLHQLACSEFEVNSMAHLSEAEVEILIKKVKAMEINWTEMEAKGICKDPEMSKRQQRLVEKLQKELGWSDEYLIKLVINKYGYLHYKYLTGRPAYSFISYLLLRKKERAK